jgi:micrococcal nuclease
VDHPGLRRLLSGTAAVLLACSAGCRDELAPPDAGRRDAGDGATDGGGGGDGGARDAERDTGVEPSPCPAPAALTPEDVPSGYLPTARVTLIRVVDGDTSHFSFDGNDRTVRFLYVNTEESHGKETTAFGEATEDRVRDEITAAQLIDVAVREEWDEPGEPDLDPYDRWLSLVFVDGTLYQTHLVREGLSAYYTRFGCAPEPVHTSLLHAEAEARAARRGIWAAGHPTDYRRVLDNWIQDRTCRPRYDEPYCP